MTPSAPSASAARRPASRVGVDRGAGGVERLHALASSAPITPAEHVAGAGRRQRGRAPAGDRDAALRLDDERVVALEHDDRARRRAAARAWCSAPRRDRVGVELQQPRQLTRRAGVRTVGARAAAQVGQSSAGVGVEAVGVEDQRDLRAAGGLARQPGGAVRAAAGPGRGRARRRGPSARGPRRRHPAASAPSASGSAGGHRLGELDREDRLQRRGHAGRDVAGAGAHGRRGRQARARRSARASRRRRGRGRR